MAQVEIEPVGPEGVHKSGQEVRYMPCRGRDGTGREDVLKKNHSFITNGYISRAL